MNPFTPKVVAVMRREFMQRVKSKWFLLSTLGLPTLIVGLMFLAGYFAVQGSEDAGDPTAVIGIVDPTGLVGDLMVEELRADLMIASVASDFAGMSEADARGRLPESDYDYLLLLPGGTVASPASEARADEEEPDATLLALDNVPEGARRTIRDGLRRALLRARLIQAGVEAVDPDELLRTTPIDIVNVTDTGQARSQEAFQVISFVIAFFFYMILLIYGQMIIRSIIEEKSSDIVEVMVSSLRPWELMLGKIIGVGAVGLAQIAIWAIILTGASIYGLTGGAAALEQAGIDLSAIAIPWGTITLVLLFLVFGYLLYAGLFAGTGATISNEQDAQQAALPVTMLIILPFLAIQGIIGSPNATWAVVVSLIPFFSPLVMTSRIFITSVPVWQWGLSLALLIICVLGAAWVAGRIYRVGILMKGQRANLPEVVRWIRHG